MGDSAPWAWLDEVQRLIGPITRQDDAGWDESEHPRGEAGTSKGGQFVKKGEGGGAKTSEEGPRGKQPEDQPKLSTGRTMLPEHRRHRGEVIDNVPKPPTWMAGAVRTIEKIAKEGLEKGKSAEEMGEALRVLTEAFSHSAIATYANNVLRYLEQEHEMDKGSLGKAVAKKKAAQRTVEREKQEGEVSLADVLARAGIGPREHQYHARAFKAANKETLAMMLKVPPVAVKVKGNKIAHYAHNRTVSMNKMPGDADASELATWRHEFFHACDYHGSKYPGRSHAYEEARSREAKRLLDKGDVSILRWSGATAESIAADLKKRVPDTDITADELLKHTAGDGERAAAIVDLLAGEVNRVTAIMAGGRGISKISGRNVASDEALYYEDFLGAMTWNKIGGGHSNAYYLIAPNRQTSEMFANYGALTNGPNAKIYRAILHAIAPETCAGFDKIIKDVGSGVS